MVTTVRNSAQWVALRMLRYLGVTSFDPKPDTGGNPDDNRTYLAEGDLDDIAGILTAALQDIFEDGPASLSNVSTGGALFAPATVTLNVTQGVAATQIVAGWQDWMNGCSVLVAGDGFVNEWQNRTGLLRRPYLGLTAQGVQATVYCNAIELPRGVKNVLEPVSIAGGHDLHPCGDRAEFDRHGGCHLHSPAVHMGWPHAYFVETRYDETLPYLPVFLRVAPAPQAALPLTFRARLNPPVIAVEDLGTSDFDPAVMPPIPGEWVESIYLPYCLQRFTGSALFKNAEARPEIARQYQEARKKLAGFKPQISRKGGLVAFRP